MRYADDGVRAQELLEEWHEFGRLNRNDYEWLYETTGSAKYILSVPQLCRRIINECIALKVTERISQ